MKQYFEVFVSINPNSTELATEVFFENFECDGVVEEEAKYKDLELIETTAGILKGYIKYEKEDFNIEEVNKVFQTTRQELLEEGFTEEELGSWKVISANIVENQDWSQKWKENWKPTQASKSIVICPSWEKYEPKKGQKVITLDPGSAFGTGTHATTQLCIQAIEKYVKEGDSVADIGTGSGILAIAAAKFGAENITAIDNDPEVIDVAQDNAQINDVYNKIKFSFATADTLTQEYDFVCANILHNVLADIMGDLKKIMKPSGIMVLSGILKEKKDIVLEAVEKHNLEVKEILNQDQWVAIVVYRLQVE